MDASAVATNGVLDWVNPIIQLVTAGGFGALVWYLVVKHIPFIESRHKAERDEWLQWILKRDEKFEAITREFITVLTATQAELSQLKEQFRRSTRPGDRESP